MQSLDKRTVLKSRINDCLTLITLLVGLMLTSCLTFHRENFTGEGGRGGGGIVAPSTPPSNQLTLSAPNEVTMHELPATVNTNVTVIGADTAYNRGYFGQNVTVAIIGKGINNHKAFSGRIVNATRISGFVITTTTDADVTTTEVAGVIGGNVAVDGGTTVEIQSGVAPQVKIIPIDVADGTTFVGTVDIAVEYAITSGAQIINYDFNSSLNTNFLLGPFLPTEILTVINSVLRNLFSKPAKIYGDLAATADVVFVSSSGNDGFNGLTTTLSQLPNSTITSTITVTVRGVATPTITTNLSLGSIVTSTIVVDDPRTITLGGFLFDGSGWNLPSPVTVTYGLNYVNGIFQSAPIFDSRLRSKFLVVGAVTVTANSTVLLSTSNGCGASKYWCLVAPTDVAELPTGNGTSFTVGTADETKYAAGIVSGALALLKSRLPNMPMAVIRGILLAAAEDLGEPGVDNVYGHGMVNIGKAITIQGHVTLEIPASVGYELPPPSEASNYSFPSTVNENLTLIGADAAYDRGYFGQGATIALIDAGVYTSHGAFAGNIVGATGVRGTTTSSTYDADEISTKIAAAAAGKVHSNTQAGVAPQAKIMPIDIVSGGAIVGSVSTAVKYAIDRGANIINFGIDNTIDVAVQVWIDYSNEFPVVSELLTRIDARTGNNIAAQSRVYGDIIAPADVVIVAGTGSEGFNPNITEINYRDSSNRPQTRPIARFLNDYFNGFSVAFGNTTVSTWFTSLEGNLTYGRLFARSGLNGVTGLFQNAPIFDNRLQSKFLVVGAVTVGTSTTVITETSNGCGSSRNWCLVAPVHSAALATHDNTDNYTTTAADHTKIASGIVSGALAVLKSRLPNMPMGVIRGILLETADDIGATGIDNVYGHGMVNLARAITIQTTVSIAVSSTMSSSTSSSSFLLSRSQIDLSPAMRGLGQRGGGISIAVGFLDDYYYDTPFSSVLKGNPSRINQLGFGKLAREDMSANKKTLGGFGLRSDSKGNLLDIDVKHKQAQLNYALCTSCSGSVWDEYKLDNEPLPFFADTERKLSSGWKVNDHIGAFVVLGLDEDNSYDKYSQYGINWSGIELGNWEFAGSFSSIKEQQGYVLGSKFSGAYAVGESSSNQIGIRAQRYIEGWRLFGGVEYGKTKVDTLNLSSVRDFDDIHYAGWRFGLDKDSVLRGNDKLHFGLTKLPSIISGSMNLMLSQTTGDTAYDADLAMEYLNKTEFRKHNIDLDGSDSFVYRLGYSTSIHKQQRLAVGLEHYADEIDEDQTAFSVQYRFDF